MTTLPRDTDNLPIPALRLSPEGRIPSPPRLSPPAMQPRSTRIPASSASTPRFRFILLSAIHR